MPGRPSCRSGVVKVVAAPKGAATVLWAALALVAAVLITSQPAFAQERLCGPVNVGDGDDLWIGDQDIRLHGIDAFEANQTCTRRDGQAWACGEAAGLKLKELVEGRGEVCCRRMQRSKTRGRVVMRCMLGEKDLELLPAILTTPARRFAV